MEKQYRVQFDFRAEHPDELSCKLGDIVFSSATPANGWLKVKQSKRGQSGGNETVQGLVPVGYLAEHKESTPTPVVPHRAAPSAPKPVAAVPSAPSIANVAVEHAECAICYEEMVARPIAILLNTQGKRACRHFLHVDCATDLCFKANRKDCPICRAPYVQVAPLVDFDKNPKKWFDSVDADGNASLSKAEVGEVLKATMAIDYKALEKNVDALWGRWDKDGSGEVDFAELCDQKIGLLVYVRAHFARVKGVPPPPLNPKNLEIWFAHWDEDGNGTLEKEEIVRALIKTFKLSTDLKRVQDMRDVVETIWSIFDHDNSGTVDLAEFISRDGLGESLCASLSFT
jgi:Ca2+-binding EF-hand superfamily protein